MPLPALRYMYIPHSTRRVTSGVHVAQSPGDLTGWWYARHGAAPAGSSPHSMHACGVPQQCALAGGPCPSVSWEAEWQVHAARQQELHARMLRRQRTFFLSVFFLSFSSGAHGFDITST